MESQKNQALKLITLALLSLFDLFSTLFLIKTGLAYEANPLMAQILDNGDGLVGFVAIKLLAFTFLAFLYPLVKTPRAQKLLNAGLNFSLFVYSCVFCWHCYLIDYAIRASGA